MTHRENWRLIMHAPHGGAWNMAVDEALLQSVSDHEQPPTLRLYDWHPFTLSLGQAQPIDDVNLQELNRRGWDLVRRPTGGRAILHADELTYSISAPIENPILRGNVIESYRRISTALVEALRLAGLCTDSKPKNTAKSHMAKDPVCFKFPSDYEITYQGKKIVGSAQSRKKGGILQHGSIPLFGDITRIIDVLNFSNPDEKQGAKANLRERATTLTDSLGQPVHWSRFSGAMVAGFKNILGVEFDFGALTRSEIKAAETLFQEKYNHPDWTARI